jgi:4-hydroxy-2-oxoheptanedioate aldolase
MLDAGAVGLICPMIETRAQAEAFVGACYYSRVGYRSYGQIRAGLDREGGAYVAEANDSTLTFAQIETKAGLDNLAEILSVERLSGVYIGTMDLSLSLSLKPPSDLAKSEARNRFAGTRRNGHAQRPHHGSSRKSAE